MNTHRNVCYHESAHALVQHLVGIQLVYVEIYTKDNIEFSGICYNQHIENGVMRKECVANLLAGMFGEKISACPSYNTITHDRLVKVDEAAMKLMGSDEDRKGDYSSMLSLFLDELKYQGRGISESESHESSAKRLQYEEQLKNSVPIATTLLSEFAHLVGTWVNSNAEVVGTVAAEIFKQPFVIVPPDKHNHESCRGRAIYSERFEGNRATEIFEGAGLIAGSYQSQVNAIALPNLSTIR